MSDAVMTGVFALGGVLVGGLLNGWVTYLVERRRQYGAARAAAWLLLANLSRSIAAVKRGRDRGDWLGAEEAIRLGEWEDRRELLFGTMRLDDIYPVVAVHRFLEEIAARGGTSAPKQLLDDAVASASDAGFALERVAAYGPRRRLPARIGYWLRYRKTVQRTEY
jgi:hypothetical protein